MAKYKVQVTAVGQVALWLVDATGQTKFTVTVAATPPNKITKEQAEAIATAFFDNLPDSIEVPE